MIKILYLLPSPVHGGVEEHVLSLIRGLDPERFSKTVVCPEPLLRSFAKELQGLEARCVPLHFESPGSLRHWRDAVGFYQLCRALRPDIVNCHLLRGTLIGAPLAKLARVPCVIATNHGPDPWRRGPIKGWYAVDRFVDRFIDQTIAVCQSAKDHLVQVKKLGPAKITVINNGRELHAYRPALPAEVEAVRAELGTPSGPILGCLGRLDQQKGHAYLLRAMPEVLTHHPDARLLLVGEGALRGDLERLAGELGLTDRVIFAGFRSDVRRMVGAMDVAVLPSLWEGLPLTVIEALAMAKPVIASAVNGVLDLIEDSATGVLVPAADSLALAKAINRLLDHPAEAEALGRAGRVKMLRDFDIIHQITRTAQLYERCLADAAGRGER